MNDSRTDPPLRYDPSAEAQLTPDDCPALATFLGGYLHEDFLLDYGSAAAAAYAFAGDADPDEVAELAAEWGRIEALAAHWTLAELAGFLGRRFGCAWQPGSHGEVAAVGAELRRALLEL